MQIGVQSLWVSSNGRKSGFSLPNMPGNFYQISQLSDQISRGIKMLRLHKPANSVSMWPLIVTAILSVNLVQASAQGPKDIIYMGTKGDDAQLMPLITHRKVRRDIELSLEQHDELKPHIALWKESFVAGKPDKFRDQSKWIKILDDVLLRHQMERLEQIHWRAMGIHVLGSPRFQERLKLTREETQGYERLRRYMTKEGDTIMKKRGDNSQGHAKRVAAMMKNIELKVKELLDEEQLKQFKKLLGKPFDLENISRPKY